MNFYRHKLEGSYQSRGAILAPMAGYTDAPFRKLARAQGALWAVSEMMSARGVLEGGLRTLELGQPYPDEPDLVLQLFSADPLELADAAQQVLEQFRPSAIDLNLGCPVPKVRGRGGSSLLQTPELAAQLVSSLKNSVPIAVSAKMRLGWDVDRSLEVARLLEDAGADLIAVHGRTAAQKYEGLADWNAIGRVARALSIPVVGCGDVRTVQDYQSALESGVSSVMVGRGAVGNPFLFREVRGFRAASRFEKLEMALEHARLNVEWYGERSGLRQLRKVLIGYTADFPELRAAVTSVETLQALEGVLLPLLERNPVGATLGSPLRGVQ